MAEIKYKDVLADFITDIDNNPNLTDEEIFKAYPEFNNDKKLLDAAYQYRNTWKANDYDEPTLQSKFPEFFTPAQPAQPTQQQSPDRITNAFAQMPDPLYSGQYQYHQQVADKETQLKREQAATLPLSPEDIARQEQIDNIGREDLAKRLQGSGISFGTDPKTGLPTINQTTGQAQLYTGLTPAQEQINKLNAQKPSYLSRPEKTIDDVLTNVREAWTTNTETGRAANSELEQERQSLVTELQDVFAATEKGKEISQRYSNEYNTAFDKLYKNQIQEASKGIAADYQSGKLSKQQAEAQIYKIIQKYQSEFAQTEQAKDINKRLNDEYNAAFDAELGDTYTERMTPLIQAFEKKMYAENGDYIKGRERELGQAATISSMDDWKQRYNYQSMLDQYQKDVAAYRRTGYNNSSFEEIENARKVYEAAEPKYQMARAANGLIEDTEKLIDAVKQGKSFGGGFVDGVTDLKTWDFGLGEVIQNYHLGNIVKKQERYEKTHKDEDRLTEQEQMLLDAAAIHAMSQMYYAELVSRGYKAGQATAASVPYMLEFAVMPIEAITNTVARGVLRYGALRFGRKFLPYTLRKTAAKGVGSLAAAGVQTATFGGAHIESDYMRRMTGQIMAEIGEDGRVQYAGIKRGSQQESGEALRNAILTEYNQNLGEIILGSFAPLKKTRMVRDVMKRVEPTQLGRFIKNINNTEFARFMNKAEWHGIGGEDIEENITNLLNWGTTTDYTKDAEGLQKAGFNLDDQIDTFLALAPTSLFFGAVNTGSYYIPVMWDSAELRKTLKTDAEKRMFDTILSESRSGDFAEKAHDLIRNIITDSSYSHDAKYAMLQQIYSDYQQDISKQVETAQAEPEQQPEQPQDRQTQLRQQAAQQAQQEVQGMEHQDGNVYYVGIKGKDGSEGYAVSGNLNMQQDDKGMYSTSGRDLVTVKMNDGSVQQVPADELIVRDIPVSADELMQERTEHYFAQYANNDLFHVGDKVYLKQNGQQSAESSTIVGINDEGIEVEIIGPDNMPNTTIIPHEQAAEALAVAEGETEDNIVTYNVNGNELRLRDLGNGTYETLDAEEGAAPYRFTDADLAQLGAQRVEQPVSGQPPMQAPQQPLQQQPQSPQGPQAPAAQAPQFGSNAPGIDELSAEDFAAQTVEFMQSPKVAQGYLTAERAKVNAQLQQLEKEGVTEYNSAEEYRTKAQQLEQSKARLQAQLEKIDGAIAAINAQAEAAVARKNLNEAIRKRAAEFSKQLGANIVIFDSLEQIPESQALARQAYEKVGDDLDAWYDETTSDIYMNANAFEDMQRFEEKVFHEVVSHKGLDQLLGKAKYDKLCDAVWNSMSEASRNQYMAYARATHIRGSEKEFQRIAAKEYIAFLSEKRAALELNDQSEEANTIRSEWAKICEFLKDLFSKIFGNVQITDEDLAKLVHASFVNMQRQAQGITGEQAPTDNRETTETPAKIVPERPNSKQLQGMSYNVAEAEDMLGRMVRNILDENGYEDVEIVGVKVIGSRVNGNAREDSDLDCLIEFKGNAREDSLFNLFEEQGIELDGVKVDINPITEGKSGTIEQFMRRSDEYLAEKAAAQALYDALAQAEAETDTNPTEAQKKAENYKQGHVTLWGLPITIENPKGSIRRGTDANGKQWEQEMHHTYGKIRRTEGVDGDHIDVFIGPNLTSDKVFVVDQRNVDTGEFDEHKCMLGFDSLEDAQNGYLSNYEEGWQGMGTVTEVTMDEFKKWIDSSHRKTKPFAEYKSVKAEGAAATALAAEPIDITKPLNSLAEVKKVMDAIGYEGTLSKVLTNDAGKKFVKYKANGVVTPNIYLGETTPRDILEQFYLYDNVMGVNIPADLQAEFDKEKARAQEVRNDLYASDREQIKQMLTEEGIPFVDVVDSERGSRIIFTDRKNENGNYTDWMDVADADRAREDISFIRAKASTYNRPTSETPAENQTPLEAAQKRKAAREAAKAAEQAAQTQGESEMLTRLRELQEGEDQQAPQDYLHSLTDEQLEVLDKEVNELWNKARTENNLRDLNDQQIREQYPEAWKTLLLRNRVSAENSRRWDMRTTEESIANRKAHTESEELRRYYEYEFAYMRASASKGDVLKAVHDAEEYLAGLSYEELAKIYNEIVRLQSEHDVPWILSNAYRARSANMENEGVFDYGLNHQGEIPEGKANKPKINASDWTAKDDLRPVLQGVYHDPTGVGVVTNAHILMATPSLYDPVQEGKIVKKDGSTVDGKFPNWQGVVDQARRINKKEAVVDWTAIRNFIAGIKAKMKEEGNPLKKDSLANIIIRMPDGQVIIFRLNMFIPFADAAAAVGANTLHYSPINGQTLAETGDSHLVIMPVDPESFRKNLDWGYKDNFYYDLQPKQDEPVSAETPQAESKPEHKPKPTRKKAAPAEQTQAPVETDAEVIETQKPKNTDKIEDVGEKIGGARKDIVQETVDRINVNGDTFAKIFPKFDYHKLIANGLEPRLAAGLKYVCEHAKKSYKIRKKRFGENNALEATRFMANYAKGYLLGDTSLDFTSEGWVFTAYGKRRYEFGIKLWESLREAMGDTMFDVDLSGYDCDVIQSEEERKAEAEEKGRTYRPSSSIYYRRNADGESVEFTPRYAINTPKGDKLFTAEEYDQAVQYFQDQVTSAINYQAANPFELAIYRKRGSDDCCVHAKIGGKWVELTPWGKEYGLKYRDEHRAELQAMAQRKAEELKEQRKNTRPEAKVEVKWFPGTQEQPGEYRIATKVGTEYVPISDPMLPKDIWRYAREHHDELQAKAQELLNAYLDEQEANRGWKPQLNIGGLRNRVGTDWRNGADVTAERFRTEFGFRGVEFGNYVTQKERQRLLNECFDALHDMAEILGVSPRALSLKGQLGFAIGARGGAGAKAHYEPGKNVINLTKKNGWGALAHEWWHAMDYYFGKREKERPATSGIFRDDVRKQMQDAFAAVMKAINGSEYLKRSQNLDAKTNKRYYAEDTELGSRAFEDYIAKQLIERGQVNDFLSHHTSEEDWNGDISNYPYPIEKDGTALADAFQSFFDTVEEQEDASTGNSVLFSVTDKKYAQFALTQANNPMLDDVHTGIRSVEDIHTLEETLNDDKLLVTEPDWEEEDIRRAIEDNQVTIYSSKPIQDGTFVTPSRMVAEDYAGGEMVYEKTVTPDKVAWIASDEGQYADVDHYDGNILFSITNANNEIFYSNAERAVEGIKQEKATPEQWRAMIEKAGGLKAGEDKWIGLSDWLAQQRPTIESHPDETPLQFAQRAQAERKKFTISKQEILHYIRANKIQIEETEYGETTPENNPTFRAFQDEVTEMWENVNRMQNGRFNEANQDIIRFEDDMQAKYGDDWQDLMDDSERNVANYLQERRDEINMEVFLPEEVVMEEMCNRHGDDFQLAFSIDDDGSLSIANEDAAGYYLDVNPINDTRLQYTTEGLTNKHEIAMTVPTIEAWNETDEIHFGDAGEGKVIAWARFGDAKTISKPEELVQAEKESKDFSLQLIKKYGFTYTESDMTEEEQKKARELEAKLQQARKDHPQVEGKVLVIDEIQSKRHQEGREKGYVDVSNTERIKYLENKIQDGYSLFSSEAQEVERLMQKPFVANEYHLTPDATWLEMYDDEYQYHTDFAGKTYSVGKWVGDEEDARQYLHELITDDVKDHNKSIRDAIPAAPFEKNWHELAMKRILRYAAENGYDKVAWTTGDQQAARYNIGEVIDSITRNEDEDYPYSYSVMSKDHGELEYDFDENGIYHDDGDPELDGKSMSDVFGKELAKRLQEMPAGETIDNEGLRIGGEGMRGFYDDMLPRFMQKYGKKWGAQVGSVQLPELREKEWENGERGGLEMHSIDITPEMRESVLQGQPMFSITNRSHRPIVPISKGIQAINIKDNRIDLSTIENRRFMYNPKTGTLVLGKEGAKIDKSSHAEELADSGVSEPFDDFARGWIGYSKRGMYKNGVIHFAPSIGQMNFDQGFDTLSDLSGEFGVNGNTLIRGFVGKWEQPLSEIFPNRFSSSNVLFSMTPKEIKERAIANGTFMKAPNGKPTNLTEQQWLQVRTDEFKRWFGDWELALLYRQAKNAWNDPNSKSKYVFAPSEALAKEYQEKLGHEIRSIIITDDAIRHIKNEHGSGEESRGQVNMTPEDVVLIPYLLNNFDVMVPDPDYDDKQGNRSVAIWKRINGVSVIATIEKGKDKEFLVTNWKFIKSNALDALIKKTPGLNVRNDFDAAKVQKEIDLCKYFAENSSKIVDFNGEPAIFYHGDRQKGKTIFGKNTFFTPSPEYAKRYTGGSENGEVISVFLDIKKPFDIRDAKAAKIFLDYRGGHEFAKTNSGAMDWAEFDYDDLQDYLEENYPNEYDGIVLDEGADGGYGAEVVQRGLSYVPFRPNQIKSATDNNGEFSPENNNILFSITPKNTSLDQVLFSITVNHNSPYLLKKADGSFVDPETGERLGFDHRFMGTGEGAQSHGWGSYFSQNDIEGYRQETTTYKDEPVAADPYSDNAAERALFYKEQEGGTLQAIKFLRELIREEEDADTKREYQESIDALMDVNSWGERRGHQYTVEIPDNDGTNYLDEMKTLPKPLRRKIAAAVRELPGEPMPSVKYVNYTGGWRQLGDMIERNQWAYLEIRDRLFNAFGGYPIDSEKKLSKMMSSLGFVGVRYDGRRDGECYVIFDENDAKIVDHVMFSITEKDPLKRWEAENPKPEAKADEATIDYAKRLQAWNKERKEVEQAVKDAQPLYDHAEYDGVLFSTTPPFTGESIGDVAASARQRSDLNRKRRESAAITDMLIKLSKDNYWRMQEALHKINADIRALRKAAAMQADLDRSQVEALLDLTNQLIQVQWGGGSDNPAYQPQTMATIIQQVRNAIGKADISEEVGKIEDYLVHAQRVAAKNQWDKLRRTPFEKLNISGVVSQGKVAIQGQHALKALNEALNSRMTVEQLEEEISLLYQKIDEATDESLRTQYTGRMIGYETARQHLERLEELMQERQQLRNELEASRTKKELSPAARRELEASIKETLRDNNLRQAEAYTQSVRDLQEYVSGQTDIAKNFIEQQRQRTEMIRGYAAKDLEGASADPHRTNEKQSGWRKIWDAFASPIRDLQSLLRLTGLHAPDGEGYLYNHFMRNWTDAADKERQGIVAAQKTLDAKISELTHGKYKTWEEAARDIKSKSHNKLSVSLWTGKFDGAQPVYEDRPIDAGNALYIYAVNKMNDGRMKLTAMNITDQVVRDLSNQVKEMFGQELLDVVDWVQREFFSELRNRYNPTHEALFGAPMDAIENYFPLRINASARQKDEDITEPDDDTSRLLAGTSTGAIKRRKRNSLPLDVRNADFFQEVIRHVAQMERWNAFAQWTRDSNILFSDIDFRNKIKNMDTIYGKGDKLYTYMKKAFQTAVGIYKPQSDIFSEMTLNLAKGVTSAKINFRVFTALKQLASFPAFFTYMTESGFVKSYMSSWAHPHDTMKWAKANLPSFEKRVSKRDMGDMRLMQRSTDWEWNKRMLEFSQKYGMYFNVLFDTLTCATGAKAVYESRLAEYKKKGYSTAVAESRARQDAEQAFNTSQQSSEGAYMAPVQMDRNIITAALTVFRTSPIQYTRNCFYHARNLIRKRGKGTKESMINFRTGQYIADGLTEEQARQAAEKDYNKSVARDIVGMVVYGALLGILWRMVGSLPYLIAGDDDDEKKKILKKAVTGGAIVQPVTGLLGGGIVESAIDGYGNIADMFSPELPFTQDLKKAYDNIGNDKYAEAASQALSVMMQSATGFDPSTVADMITRTVTTLDSDAKLDAAQQAWQITGAVLSIPQSQYEQIMLDDLVKAGKGIDMSNTFGKRKFEPIYDKYLSDFSTNREIRTAPLTWYLRSDEQAQKAEASAERRFRKLLKERGLNDLPNTKASRDKKKRK